MNFGNVARVLTISAACFAAVGSATSNTNNGPAAQQQSQMESPPPPQQMDAARALGLWRSTFGAVKIEADNSHGGLQAGAIQGVWMYQRQGQDVIGLFYGTLQGNVLKFRWQEPGNPPLTGEGYLVFEASGRQYSGRWWTDKRDRVGDWNGSRAATEASGQPYGASNAQYGGAQYGGQPQAPQQPAYPQQPTYPPQQQPYPPQPAYPQQPAYPPQQPAYPPQQQPYPPQQQPYPQQQQPYPPQQQPYYPQR
jgi:hypothetical protein